ncbi:DNA (cytosine-5-)-methyltransferase [Metabacillus sp. KIGAM252]|uniref:Cytosine-specific methyltransferase n=1 Tax=Metabacillus flavus TaxID=2823519 RepID=A0ABS5LIJ4_9BACI|nr:DNA (cytosine-5-)-methyltransferase [Metabacillus flavus]
MIDVVELFAGVGGFRVGLERNEGFNVIWGNQWEPSKKVQHAFDCYAKRFAGRGTHSNEDIAKVKYTVPQHDLLVGGFPCQDYSVARSLYGESGIKGKKGVLFWEIMDIVNFRKPTFVLLENVDRLLKSPASQRGRDFAIMLASFRNAGYFVEWRVINAADYGFAQKRRRVFIFAYKDTTRFASNQMKYSNQEILHEKGFFSSEFKVKASSLKHPASADVLPQDIVEISDTFIATFRNSGIMKNGEFYTEEIIPDAISSKTLGEVLVEGKKHQAIEDKYFLKEDEIGRNGKSTLEMFEYMKGPKKVERTANNGHVYMYSEGGMSFPDDLKSPARTMLTSEGTKNRSTHVVRDPETGRLRILTPVECELLNDFPPNWTEGMPDKSRYFCMGNALVVGLIEKMGKKIKVLYSEEVSSIENKYVERIKELEEVNGQLVSKIKALTNQLNNKTNKNFIVNTEVGLLNDNSIILSIKQKNQKRQTKGSLNKRNKRRHHASVVKNHEKSKSKRTIRKGYFTMKKVIKRVKKVL